jgi:hypothetical protein
MKRAIDPANIPVPRDTISRSDTVSADQSRLYVVGGQQRSLRPLTAGLQDWYEYQKAVILDLHPGTGQAEVAVEYVSPPETCPPDAPAILFKSGTLVGNHLYVCTQTEVLVYAVPSFERVAYVSLPLFNDVHHVRPTPDGNLLIANTGLDMVVEATTSGDIVRLWNVLGEDPWARFSSTTDYRRIRTTKPHHAHPNHVFYLGDEPWATRFEQKDAISLFDPTRRIDIGLERVHDGVVHQGRVYFTTVDGHVAIADAASLQVVEIIDLTEMHPDDTLLGWTRGILIDDHRMWVGFSRIRPTKFRENVAWVLRGLKRDEGTHVGCYDLRSRRSVRQIRVEQFGLSAIFGIFLAREPAPPLGASEA